MIIAIIAPLGSMPIPALLGGAIETLTTSLLDHNERSADPIEFVVFNTFRRQVAVGNKYKYTKFVFIKENIIASTIYNYFWRILRKVSKKNMHQRSYFVKKCIEEMQKNNYNYILIEGDFTQILQFKCKISSKIILHLHTDILNIKTPLCKETTSACFKIICVSNYLKGRVVDIDKSNIMKTFVLKNAIDLDLFKKRYSFRAEIRGRLGLRQNDLLIMYCGRLSKEKGVRELMLAYEKLSVKNTMLVVVGSSWFSSNIKTEYVKNLEMIAEKIEKRVEFVGYIDQKTLPVYYSSADVVVCPSIGNEAAGLVVIEALACDVPVIVSNKGGLIEYASPDSCEYVNCDDKFINNIKVALMKLLQDNIYYQKKQRMARASVEMLNLESYYENFRRLID